MDPINEVSENTSNIYKWISTLEGNLKPWPRNFFHLFNEITKFRLRTRKCRFKRLAKKAGEIKTKHEKAIELIEHLGKLTFIKSQFFYGCLGQFFIVIALSRIRREFFILLFEKIQDSYFRYLSKISPPRYSGIFCTNFTILKA